MTRPADGVHVLKPIRISTELHYILLFQLDSTQIRNYINITLICSFGTYECNTYCIIRVITGYNSVESATNRLEIHD